MEFKEWVALAGQVMEVAGIGVMVLGAVLSVIFVVARRGRRTAESAYRQFRQDLGRAILLGLEFLVAADIIRTVSEQPTLRGVLVLGLIVVIRTFLSFTLEVELEGRWPWQRSPEHAESRPLPPSSSSPQRPPIEPDIERRVEH